MLFVIVVLFVNGCDTSKKASPTKATTQATSQRSSSKETNSLPSTASEEKPKTATTNQSNEIVEPGRYVNQEFGFSIRFPTRWQQTENVGSNIIIQGLSPQTGPRDAFGENVMVSVKKIPLETRLDDYVNKDRERSPLIAADLFELDVGVTTIADQGCIWILYTYTSGTIKCKAIRYYLRKESRLYMITCTAAPETFSNYKKAFENIAKSFRLLAT